MCQYKALVIVLISFLAILLCVNPSFSVPILVEGYSSVAFEEIEFGSSLENKAVRLALIDAVEKACEKKLSVAKVERLLDVVVMSYEIKNVEYEDDSIALNLVALVDMGLVNKEEDGYIKESRPAFKSKDIMLAFYRCNFDVVQDIIELMRFYRLSKGAFIKRAFKDAIIVGVVGVEFDSLLKRLKSYARSKDLIIRVGRRDENRILIYAGR